MTRDHLIEDIRNVLELVRSAEHDRELAEKARRAVHGLYQHVKAQPGVAPQVEGCLAESLGGVEATLAPTDSRGWAHIRACLETALDFARG